MLNACLARKMHETLQKTRGKLTLNIVVINGSPRENSNTMQLADAFVEGLVAGASEECNVKVIDLKKVEVKNCLGCFTCWRHTPGKCVIKDDAEWILDYVFAADVVIWSFPLYFFSLPAKLKALVERQLPRMSPLMSENEDIMVNGGHKFRFDIADKKFILISTCGFYYTPSTYDSVRRQFDMIYGVGGYEQILIGEGELFNKPYLRKKLDGYLAHIKRAGEQYATGDIDEQTKAKINKELYPTGFYAQLADKSWGIEESDFDANDGETRTRMEYIKNNKFN